MLSVGVSTFFLPASAMQGAANTTAVAMIRLLPGAKLGGADLHSESRGRLETARSDGFGIDLRSRC
jgi:hypothetical protein